MIYDPAVNLKRSWNFSFYFKHLGKQCFWNIYQRLKKGKQKSGNWKMRNETKRRCKKTCKITQKEWWQSALCTMLESEKCWCSKLYVVIKTELDEINKGWRMVLQTLYIYTDTPCSTKTWTSKMSVKRTKNVHTRANEQTIKSEQMKWNVTKRKIWLTEEQTKTN